MDVLDELKRVLDLESETITITRNSLGHPYVEAVERIRRCSGKLILTGIGKSGLIAQKIASTMVSTGTPSLFLHPAEGLHGDIGVVQKADVVLALSKSGESDELIALLPSIKQIGACFILITGKPQSTLATQADIVLITPIKEEACPLNMAPTCSTTVALAVGDALAMTLMKLRNFKSEDFALYHPGGQLGKRLLLTVRDVMRSGQANPVIPATASIKEMLCEITGKRAGAVSVVDVAQQLLGLVTDYDIRRALEEGRDILRMTISELMNKTPTFIYEDEKAFQALEMMERRDKPFLVLPVLDRAQRVIGMVHLHDLVARGL
jgi:arabinose-5-phosphate isomerase